MSRATSLHDSGDCWPSTCPVCQREPRLRVLVTGSRGWSDNDLVASVLLDISESHPDRDITLISGACDEGADAIAEDVAAALGWEVERHPADWHLFGRAAGPIRNVEMIDSGVDLVVAFWDGSSRGTKYTINLALERRLSLYVYDEEGPWVMPSGTSRPSRVG